MTVWYLDAELTDTNSAARQRVLLYKLSKKKKNEEEENPCYGLKISCL